MRYINLFAFLFLGTILFTNTAVAREVRNITLQDDTEIELRVFPAKGNTLILGFACDEGTGLTEENTAVDLANDGIEIWMPDMLGAYMLPKVKSSLKEIPSEAMLHLITEAKKTGKKVFLIAGGADSALVLRSASEYEQLASAEKDQLDGAILLFPRLIDGAPTPGQEPKYVKAVGKTKLPLMILEGERTPNRWGINHLQTAMQSGGSKVSSKLIPSVRGYFFKRQDANIPEEVVTSQLTGLIKASLFLLDGENHETN